jgi:hypothetical protein
LLVLAGVAALVGAIGVTGGYALHLASAILGGVVFAACAAYVGLNQHLLIYGHRTSAAKLWVICEKYRALLAEMHDDLIDLPTLQAKRHELLTEYASVTEQAAPDDRYTYEIAKSALSGPRAGGYPDALIDRYLPQTLRKPVTASEPT